MPKKRSREKTYIELPDEEKLRLLNEHDFNEPGWKSLDEQRYCLHCDQQFSGRSVRFYDQDGERWVECGTPDCSGSPVDWSEEPWWRDDKKPAEKNGA